MVWRLTDKETSLVLKFDVLTFHRRKKPQIFVSVWAFPETNKRI